MSRKRSISTEISSDARLARLLRDHGPLPCLIYTWAIPHADDWGRMSGDPIEFGLLVCPALMNSVDEIEFAIRQIAETGLWIAYEAGGSCHLQFPEETWFKHQSYINKGKRTTDGSRHPAPPHIEERRETPKNAEKRQAAPKNTASPSPSPSPSLSLTPSPTDDDDVNAHTGDFSEIPPDVCRYVFRVVDVTGDASLERKIIDCLRDCPHIPDFNRAVDRWESTFGKMRESSQSRTTSFVKFLRIEHREIVANLPPPSEEPDPILSDCAEWIDIAEELRSNVGTATFKQWFAGVDAELFGTDSLLLWAPDDYTAKWISQKLMAVLLAAMKAVGLGNLTPVISARSSDLANSA